MARKYKWQTLANNLDRLSQEEPEIVAQIARGLNEMLDGMRDMDVFGTEGQLDPRGDPRR